jgi:hypothetical protein
LQKIFRAAGSGTILEGAEIEAMHNQRAGVALVKGANSARFVSRNV